MNYYKLINTQTTIKKTCIVMEINIKKCEIKFIYYMTSKNKAK